MRHRPFQRAGLGADRSNQTICFLVAAQNVDPQVSQPFTIAVKERRQHQYPGDTKPVIRIDNGDRKLAFVGGCGLAEDMCSGDRRMLLVVHVYHSPGQMMNPIDGDQFFDYRGRQRFGSGEKAQITALVRQLADALLNPCHVRVADAPQANVGAVIKGYSYGCYLILQRSGHGHRNSPNLALAAK